MARETRVMTPTLATILSAQVVGLTTYTITIEVDIFNGFHTFSIVGLPAKAVEESRDRVSSAIKSAGYTSPKSEGQKKVVVSLAPADLKKEGTLFDLPIALGYLLAAGDISFDPTNKLFVGELSLSGALRPIKGALLLAQHARDEGVGELYLPEQNAREAALIEGIRIIPVATLTDLIAHLTAPEGSEAIPPQPPTTLTTRHRTTTTEIADIKGQERAKRALEVAAAGGHNIALYGPPGTGKTLLAQALASLLPPLSLTEAIEVSGIHSIAGQTKGLITTPPFRAPHNTSSYISIIGGGSTPRPGEVTLAHRGVLFLDEFPEFDRRVIESLRQPLEERTVSIARAQGSAVFPASFMLIVALNPCPCGYYGDERTACTCPPAAIERYRRKISGPIVDRIEMWVEVSRIATSALSNNRATTETTATIRRRIEKARIRQYTRSEERLNSTMTLSEITSLTLPRTTKKILDEAADTLDLSGRAYHRIIKLARTIADLAETREIEPTHILEALQYRPKNI